ncbi:MAG TPA: hypothetical protein VNM89_00800 [Solirubrobacterales bacterium]|nr:hypothetical protein [Solirubrobacterales bacterium]
MELRCPECCSPEVPTERRGRLRCGNCGAGFERTEALVSVADAEAFADERCVCDDVRGCPPCFDRADALVGARIRDSQGREWRVEDVGEKNGFPTIRGERFWDRPDEVTVLRPAPFTAPGAEERSR